MCCFCWLADERSRLEGYWSRGKQGWSSTLLQWLLQSGSVARLSVPNQTISACLMVLAETGFDPTM
jgi:hypothetical protein